MPSICMVKPCVTYGFREKNVDLSQPDVCGGWIRRTLQRLALWLTRKTDLRYIERIKFEDSVQHVTYDHDRLLDSLHLCQRDIRSIWNNEVKYIVCGHEYYEKLIRTCDDKMFMMLPTSSRLGFNGVTQVFGLTIVLVPWMQGMVLLPDLENKSYG